MMPEQVDFEMLFYQLIASLTLCDHLGDVGNDVERALTLAGQDIEWDNWGQLGKELGRRGIKTLWGTSLGDFDD